MNNKLVLPTQNHEPCSCPQCGQLVYDVIFEYPVCGKFLPLYRCAICDLSFIRPMPIELLDARKMESIEDAELFSPFFKKLHENLILNREVRTVRSICNKADIKLLDIGCGSGWTTDFWRRKGFDVEAVEPSRMRCDYARSKYDLTVHNCYVEDLDLPGKFDVVVLRHIVEHLERPTAIINSVRRLLKDDGVILVVVPNIDCIGRKLFGRYWEWVLPWHCNFFTPKSLVCLAESCGFTVGSTYQSPTPLYYAESLGRALHSSVLESFFIQHRMACLPVALPLALLALLSGHGDNLTVIARKNREA